MSITTLQCIGGPYDGRTVDVNDRVLAGDVPIHVAAPSDDARGLTAIGQYRVRRANGNGSTHVLEWVPAGK